MSAMASQITSLAIVYSSVYSSADQRMNQSSASQAFVRGIHRWPVSLVKLPSDEYQWNLLLILVNIGPAFLIHVIEVRCGLNTLRRRQNGRHFSRRYINAFSWIKRHEFWLRFHWNLFPRVRLTVQHWFRWRPGPSQATSHYLNQWMLVY